MSNRTPESALKAYRTITDKLNELEVKHKAETLQLEQTKLKIESWLLENVKDYQTPEWLFDINPALNWGIGIRTDGLATKTHMTIDDVLIPEITRQGDQAIKSLKQILEDVESWALGELLRRGAKNFTTDVGTASIREDKKFAVEDKVLFVESMQKKGALSELTVTVRPNSKAMAAILEQDGEYPAGLQVMRINKVVFTKKR